MVYLSLKGGSWINVSCMPKKHRENVENTGNHRENTRNLILIRVWQP